ncbi:hypothetical protein [Flavobacterium alkalisoli]|uniref:hypothetical protein n=1 Tax=Flavobacterium alkalisoli TaxID=2602769 RepID=UPI003A956745
MPPEFNTDEIVQPQTEVIEEITEPEEVEELDELSEETDIDSDEDTEEVVNVDDDYVPNMTYKVLDEEKSIPEYLKAVINKENEAEIRDIFERADGLPIYKEKLSKAKEESTELKGKYGELEGNYKQLYDFQTQLALNKEEGNLSGVLDMLGFSKQDIINEAVRSFEYEQMSPEQKEYYDRVTQAQKENVDLKLKVARYDQVSEQEALARHESQMQHELTEGNFANVISQYEQATGKPFRNIVDQVGNSYFVQNKISLSPNQAVQMAVSTLGLDRVYATQPVVPETPVQVVTEQPQPTNPQPVKQPAKPANPIPNLGSGSGKAVVKQQYKTMEELRASMRNADA